MGVRSSKDRIMLAVADIVAMNGEACFPESGWDCDVKVFTAREVGQIILLALSAGQNPFSLDATELREKADALQSEAGKE